MNKAVIINQLPFCGVSCHRAWLEELKEEVGIPRHQFLRSQGHVPEVAQAFELMKHWHD